MDLCSNFNPFEYQVYILNNSLEKANIKRKKQISLYRIYNMSQGVYYRHILFIFEVDGIHYYIDDVKKEEENNIYEFIQFGGWGRRHRPYKVYSSVARLIKNRAEVLPNDILATCRFREYQNLVKYFKGE